MKRERERERKKKRDRLFGEEIKNVTPSLLPPSLLRSLNARRICVVGRMNEPTAIFELARSAGHRAIGGKDSRGGAGGANEGQVDYSSSGGGGGGGSGSTASFEMNPAQLGDLLSKFDEIQAALDDVAGKGGGADEEAEAGGAGKVAPEEDTTTAGV